MAPISILYLGPESITCLDRANALRRLGHQVKHIDPRDLLPESTWIDRIAWRLGGNLFSPWLLKKFPEVLSGQHFDLCYVDGGQWVTPKVIALLRGYADKVISYNIDNPYSMRDGARFRAYRQSLAYYDLCVVMREQNVTEAKALGAKNVFRVFMTSDEVTHAPRVLTAEDHQKWDSEVLFLGTWMPERGPFLLELVQLGVPLTIRGSSWHKAPEWEKLRPYWKGGGILGDDYAKAIQCAKVNLGLLSKGNRDLHTTRSSEIPALGGLLCAERTTEHMAMYDEGTEALFWSDAKECAEMCRFALSDEARRQAIAQAGHARVQKNGHYNEPVLEKIINKAFEIDPTPVKKMRVAIIVSHPIQHFVHLYKALAKHPQIDLKVFFASSIGVKPYYDQQMAVEIQWAMDLLGGYEHEFLPEADTITTAGFKEINNPSIVPALKQFAPDVVQLHGYAQITLLRALLWCSLKRIPVLLWSDSSLLFQRTGWKAKLKEIFLPWLLKLFSGVLSTGDNNADYYHHYGINPSRIFYCPFTIDKTELDAARVNRVVHRQVLRQQYGIAQDEYVLLYVGKLVPWKRPIDLLDALKAAQVRVPDHVRLVAFFAGDGPLRKELEAHRNQHEIRAIFGGFINVDVLPSIYAMADALVFPSDREPYGLSAREAICVGLPLIVSDQIGCVGSTDAARPGSNALMFASRDVAALTDCIVRLTTDSKLQQNLSQASLDIAQQMDETVSVNGFVRGVKEVLGLPQTSDV